MAKRHRLLVWLKWHNAKNDEIEIESEQFALLEI
jgi:hypothetical protein